MIAGIGIDLVDVARIAAISSRWQGAFLRRVYTEAEIAYCRGLARPAVHLAARFAVKEAFLKSLGLGLGMGIRLRDVETVNDPDGRPRVRLAESARVLMSSRGIDRVKVSITHTREQAAAIVTLEKRADRVETGRISGERGDETQV